MINNIQVVAGNTGNPNDFNKISGDANNYGDNIHPQHGGGAIASPLCPLAVLMDGRFTDWISKLFPWDAGNTLNADPLWTWDSEMRNDIPYYFLSVSKSLASCENAIGSCWFPRIRFGYGLYPHSYGDVTFTQAGLHLVRIFTKYAQSGADMIRSSAVDLIAPVVPGDINYLDDISSGMARAGYDTVHYALMIKPKAFPQGRACTIRIQYFNVEFTG